MAKTGVLGTGMVGKTIGSKLVQLGYEVKMGSRTKDNYEAGEWVKTQGGQASQGTFEEAAAFGDIVFNCTKGENALDALKLAGNENLKGKILIDISNPLDFSKGMPPTLLPNMVNTNSLGEEIQKWFPDTQVVKTLNIVNCEVMVDASRCGGDATMFLAGNSEDAKRVVERILRKFGWTDIMDLGEIKHARSTEMMLPVWLSVYMATQNGYVGFKIVR